MNQTVQKILALLAIIVFSPIILIAIVAIVFVSPGNPFYVQKRVGKNGTIFRLYKLRTMTRCADKQSSWTVHNDCRVLPYIGRLLRKLSIDEMPQFVNVLMGDLNLVGPRPEQPQWHNYFGDRIERYHQRITIKPGITGWAQIHCNMIRCNVAQKVQFDLWYVDHRSWIVDIYVLWKTATLKRTSY